MASNDEVPYADGMSGLMREIEREREREREREGENNLSEVILTQGVGRII